MIKKLRQIRERGFTPDSTSKSGRGFTLIETLVAVALLTISIVAPMTLTAQSLAAAYYARDQITAYNLAQEGIEAVRAVRDGQVLLISGSSDATGIDLFGTVPVNQDFIIDARETNTETAMEICSGRCPPLQTDGTLYGYNPDTSSWPPTQFIRSLRASYVPGTQDEIRLAVTVTWTTAVGQPRTFTIYANVYRWLADGSAAL
jgi:prepilin-type N-terminal cleavage/methylation domain-containing protein